MNTCWSFNSLLLTSVAAAQKVGGGTMAGQDQDTFLGGIWASPITTCALLFTCLFSMKLFDGIVDDGLKFFKGDRFVLGVAMASTSMSLMFQSDFCAIWFTGMTIACIPSGKLDCFEFIACALGVLGLCAWRFMQDATFTHTIAEMIIIAVIVYAEELVHDFFSDDDNVNGKTKTSALSKFGHYLNDHRCGSTIAIVPIFLLKGHSYVIAIIMIIQLVGYEMGGVVTDNISKTKGSCSQGNVKEIHLD